MDKYQLDTLAVRTGIHRSQFGEHSEAMYLTSSFVFDNAAQAAEARWWCTGWRADPST
jgi:O-succinylhomoserine sulfhydrylase